MRAISILLILSGLGCGDPIQVGPPPPPADPGAADPNSDLAQDPNAADAGAGETGLDYSDEDFVASEFNRDPFAIVGSLRDILSPEDEEAPEVQVDAVLPGLRVSELRLTAVITGVASPRAMVLDPNGVGHVIRRGDYIGRPEVVQTGGIERVNVQLHWRVERIREDGIVLSREDPTAPPGEPPLTHVISLYNDGEVIDPRELLRQSLVQ